MTESSQPTEISNMNFTDLPCDCILIILEHLANTGATLTELLYFGFTSSKLFVVLAKLMKRWKGTSLKIFDAERNLDLYRRVVISDLLLQKVDDRFELKEPASWKEQDIIILDKFTEVPVSMIMAAIVIFFSKNVTNLVINALNLDQEDILNAFNNSVTTLTFIELPNCSQLQKTMWTQIKMMPNLKHLHLFYMEGILPLDVDLILPLFDRLETLTLDRYRHDNLMQVLSVLNANVCTRLCLGRFYNDAAYNWIFENTSSSQMERVLEGTAFVRQLETALPQLAPHFFLLDTMEELRQRQQEVQRRRIEWRQEIRERWMVMPNMDRLNRYFLRPRPER